MATADDKPRDEHPRPTEAHEGLPGYYRAPRPPTAPAPKADAPPGGKVSA